MMDGNEYDYGKLCEDILRLRRDYDFLRIGSIGKSLCGRTLFMLEFGEGCENVLYAGTFHGMERITTALLMKFVFELCEAYRKKSNYCGLDVCEYFSSRRLCIVPCVNPDGVEIALHGSRSAGEYAAFVKGHMQGPPDFWQANARGVDINHNFNAGWRELKQVEMAAGYTQPGPTRFGGYAPETEPESVALASFCRNNCIKYALAFHSQGEEIYYTYKGKTPDGGRKIAGNLARLSGYTLAFPEEPIASLGGFKDWFIEYFGRPAFTVEIGKGRNPLPPEDLSPIYSKLKRMLSEGIKY